MPDAAPPLLLAVPRRPRRWDKHCAGNCAKRRWAIFERYLRWAILADRNAVSRAAQIDAATADQRQRHGAACPLESTKRSPASAFGLAGSNCMAWKKTAAMISAAERHEVGWPEPGCRSFGVNECAECGLFLRRAVESDVSVLPACPIAVMEFLLRLACGAKRQTGRILYRTVRTGARQLCLAGFRGSAGAGKGAPTLAAPQIAPFASPRFSTVRMDARRAATGA